MAGIVIGSPVLKVKRNLRAQPLRVRAPTMSRPTLATTIKRALTAVSLRTAAPDISKPAFNIVGGAVAFSVASATFLAAVGKPTLS